VPGQSECGLGPLRVWGADLLLRYHADDHFFGWIAYTLSRSTEKPGPGEPEKLAPNDQTHLLNLVGSYRLGRGWEAGGRFRYTTGFVYDACSAGLFDNSQGSYRCYGAEKQKRLGLHCLSFGLDLDSFSLFSVDGTRLETPRKSLWLDYFANAGSLPDDEGSFAVHPPTGAADAERTECIRWQAPRQATEHAHLWAVLRDNRGGLATFEQRIAVR
jgi:hypothetical protein